MLVYKPPVIFLVLSHNTKARDQNVSHHDIELVLATVNRLYRGQEGGEDIHVEFVHATHDPNGLRLSEKGVERIHWYEDEVDAPLFMKGTSREHLNLL